MKVEEWRTLSYINGSEILVSNEPSHASVLNFDANTGGEVGGGVTNSQFSPGSPNRNVNANATVDTASFTGSSYDDSPSFGPAQGGSSTE